MQYTSAKTGANRDGAILGPLQTVVPIYVIGDSHVLAYSHLTCTEQRTGGTVATRVKYIPSGFTGYTFFQAGTGLPAELVEALEYESLLRNGRAVHLSMDRIDLAISSSTERPQGTPLIVLSCGDIDVRGALLTLLKDERDFIPPQDSPYPHSGKPLLPFDFCQRLVEERMNPLLDGVQKMRALGFTRTYLHCIVPPTTNDKRFRDIHGFDCPATTRYKAARIFNDYLAVECKKRSIPFIDIWQETTRDGYLRPEYELDGVHLTREATRISLQLLVDNVFNYSWLGVNYRRYELYYHRCCPAAPAPVQPSAPTSGPNPPPVQFEPPIPVTQPPEPQMGTLSSGSDSHVVEPRPKVLRSGILRRTVRDLLPVAVRRRLRKIQREWTHRTTEIPPPVALLQQPNLDPISVPAPELPTPPVPVLAPALIEVSNVPPANCTAGAPANPVLPDIAWLREAVQSYRTEGRCVLQLDRGMVDHWKNSLDFSLDIGNRHPRWDWYGKPIRSYTKNVLTADPSLDLLQGLHQILDQPDLEQFFLACVGCPIIVLNCRLFRSLRHAEDGVGPQAWHGDGTPAGVIRGLIFLTDVDEDSGPFQYQDAAGEVHSVIGPAGTFVIFDANRLLHRAKPPKHRERMAIDLVFLPRHPGEPLQVIFAGMNAWPVDPFQYSLGGMLVYPPTSKAECSFATW